VTSEVLELLMPIVGLSDNDPPPNQQVSLEKLNCLDDVPHLREKAGSNIVAGVLDVGIGALAGAACTSLGWCLARWRQARVSSEAEVQVNLAHDPELAQVPSQVFMSSGQGGQCFHCNRDCFGLRKAREVLPRKRCSICWKAAKQADKDEQLRQLRQDDDDLYLQDVLAWSGLNRRMLFCRIGGSSASSQDDEA
jgi:hypothetical protein